MSRESYSSQKHEYQALMNELNKQVIQNQPEDVLQFCFNFFLQRLNNERSKVRDQTHWTQGKKKKKDVISFFFLNKQSRCHYTPK